jgi:hypothetical protein
MRKLLIGTALLFAALPFTFDGVTPAISKAQAVHRQRVVIPLTQATVPPLTQAAVPPWALPTPHWNAPIFAYSGTVPLTNPSARYGCYPAPFGQSFHYCAPRD